jgi:lysophospholipase L1-like esterase
MPSRARVPAAALLAGLVLSSACSRHDTSTTPTTPTAPAAGAPVVYTAVGASDAVGVGGSVLCLPLAACPNGTGYVAIIARQLAASHTTTLTNLGVPGAVLSAATQALARQYGRDVPGNFIDNELPLFPRTTTVVTVFAGGNDVNAIGAAIEGGAGGGDEQAFIDQQIRQFGSDLDQLLRGIHERAPTARIVIANLPNLAALPYASGDGASRKDRLRTLSVGFSAQAINPLASQGVAVVDLLCDPRSYDAGNVSSDGFHPNDRGYAYMAETMFSALTSPTYPPPRGTCAEAGL